MEPENEQAKADGADGELLTECREMAARMLSQDSGYTNQPMYLVYRPSAMGADAFKGLFFTEAAASAYMSRQPEKLRMHIVGSYANPEMCMVRGLVLSLAQKHPGK